MIVYIREVVPKRKAYDQISCSSIIRKCTRLTQIHKKFSIQVKFE